MAPPRIPPQDPSMSPTYSMSTNQTQHPVPASLRRNLFAGHRSRRQPAASSRDPFGPPSPTHNAQSTQESEVYSSTPLIREPASNKRTMAFQDIYDPSTSPTSRAMSPSTSSTTFSRDTIVAVHPVTGRPVLPSIPTLPPRLRLSDGEDDDDDDDSDIDQEAMIHHHHHHHTRAGFTRSPSYHNNLNHHLPPDMDYDFDPDMELDSSELERLAMYGHSTAEIRRNLNHFLDANAEESRADRERIETLLANMLSRQRARARMITTTTTDTTADATNSGSDSQPRSRSRSSSKTTSTATTSSRSRRAVGAEHPGTNGGSHAVKSRGNRQPSPLKYDSNSTHKNTRGGATASTSASVSEHDVGPVGPSMDSAEREELIGLIMTSLRRKLQVAEEEGWMYGGVEGLGDRGVAVGVGEDNVYEQ